MLLAIICVFVILCSVYNYISISKLQYKLEYFSEIDIPDTNPPVTFMPNPYAMEDDMKNEMMFTGEPQLPQDMQNEMMFTGEPQDMQNKENFRNQRRERFADEDTGVNIKKILADKQAADLKLEREKREAAKAAAKLAQSLATTHSADNHITTHSAYDQTTENFGNQQRRVNKLYSPSQMAETIFKGVQTSTSSMLPRER
jgi:hypothetical protein